MPPSGQRLESHTKTLMERVSPRNQLSPLPKIGEGFREWSEASSYGKKRLEMLRWLQAKPATGSGGIPQHSCVPSVARMNEKC